MLGQAWWLKLVILEFRRPGQKHLQGLQIKFQVSIGYRKRASLKTHREKEKKRQGRKKRGEEKTGK